VIKPPAGPPAAPDQVAAIVERWFSETFFNVQLDTQLFNRIRASQERLKTDLAALLGKD